MRVVLILFYEAFNKAQNTKKYNDSCILKFINKYSLQDKAYYIHALQDGQWRYILLYGDYPNNRTSKAVAKTLPQEIQDNGYWIRTYGDLRRSYTIAP